MKKYFIKLLGLLIFILPVTLFIVLASMIIEAIYTGTAMLVESCVLVVIIFPVLTAWADLTNSFMTYHFGEKWLRA